MSDEFLDVLSPGFFGIDADSARFFATLPNLGGSNSASINAFFTGPDNWLDAGLLPGEEIFTSEIIETGSVVVTFASLEFIEQPCNTDDGSTTGPCFGLGLVESSAVIEVETVSSNGRTLWVSPSITEEVPVCTGDLTGDNVVDFGDFGAFVQRFDTSCE